VDARRAGALFCLIAFGVIWFWGIGHRPLFNTDEGRYAEIPREMLVSGNWVTPRLDGLRYFEKPPLQYWMTAAAYAIFGVHDWAARLATTLASFFTVLFAGLAAARLYGREAGWYAAVALAGSFYFGFLGHFNTLDAVLALAMSVNLFGFLLAQRAPPGSRAELAWMLVSWAGAALAVLTKGLIGIILPGAVLVVYLLLRRDWGLIRRLRLPAGIVLFFAMTLPWFIAVSLANHGFLWQFFMVQQFLRFLTPAQHRPGPWWYFIPLLVLAVLPWLIAAARALVHPTAKLLARGRFNYTVLLWVWIVLIFVFFSASHSKLPSYILPIIPALALLIGRELARAPALPWAGAIISILVGAAVIALAFFAPGAGFAKDADPAMLHAFLPWIMAAGVVIAVATAIALLSRRRSFPAIVLIGAAWLVATRLVMLGGAAFGPEYSTRGLAAAVARYNRPHIPIYSVDGYQQTLPFYLRRKMILVSYQGELDFGIRNARSSLADRYLPNLAAFAARWGNESAGLAFVPRKKLAEVKALGIRYRIVAGNARWVAFIHGTGA
jgi:4-amino-4-deoxy-L-arabinose transferase-like glycosyltransferase